MVPLNGVFSVFFIFSVFGSVPFPKALPAASKVLSANFVILSAALEALSVASEACSPPAEAL